MPVSAWMEMDGLPLSESLSLMGTQLSSVELYQVNALHHGTVLEVAWRELLWAVEG